MMDRIKWSCLISVSLFLFAINLRGQENNKIPTLKESRATQTFYFEALGNGLVYSLNYDELILHNGKEGLSFRAGLSLYPLWANDEFPSFVIPLEVNYLTGNEKMVEIGLGGSVLNYGNNFWPAIRFGHRTQKIKGGTFLRFGFLIGYVQFDDDGSKTKRIIPTLGLGVGCTQK